MQITRLDALTDIFSRERPSAYVRLCKYKYLKGCLGITSINRLLVENGYTITEVIQLTPKATQSPTDSLSLGDGDVISLDDLGIEE